MKMNPSALILLSSIVVLASCAGAPKSYYNRRAFPPQKYYYGHKGGYNPGPPINKYRPPGFRATRNPYIGPGPGAGFHHRDVSQGLPQNIHPGPAHVVYQGVPQGLSQGIHQGFQQGVPQVIPQGVHQGGPQVLHQPIPQTVPQGIPPSGHPGQHQVLHQQVPQGIHHNVRILQPQGGPHPGHTHQLIPQQSELVQTSPAKRFTPTPPPHTKTVAIPQFTSAAPYKSQPSHLNSINNDFINDVAPSFTASTKAYYKPNDERSPIHTIPAPNLSPADKPADFEYRIQQQAQEQAAQKQAIQQRAAQQQLLQQQAAQQQVLQQQAALQQAAQQQAIQQQSTHQQYPSTPSFKTLDKAITQQIKTNPTAFLTQQTPTHYAPDPGTLNAPRLPQTNDPFSQPSNGQLPIDIYLQQQLDNEIAQQESLYIQQQKAQEAIQYQQQLEAAQLLAAQQEAYQAHHENLKQQLMQQQALEAQQQLAHQAQQHALLQQQAVLQQQQYEQAVTAQQQPSESLTAEELYNLMNGIPQQVSTPSIQNVLATPQQNEVAGAATTNFQPNYQSFNYDEKAHQQQRQVEQTNNLQGNDLKRATSESAAQTNFNPQYQNFNYDEKTKRNGFNNEGNGVEQQTKVDDSVQNTSNVESKDKKEKRFQKNTFVANQGYTVGYSTLPKEITDNAPQIQYNNHQQSGYSTAPGNHHEKLNLPPSRRVKPDGANEIKKVPHLKKKAKLPNNGYSTIAEDLLQQHDLKKDLQQLTYSTLPNKKILEVLKNQRHYNSSHQVQQAQAVTTEKDNLQKMRENAQKFYNPHILQAVRNNTSNENVQIQQSIQIYENNYASKGDDNHIDLSGITTTSTTTPASPSSSTTAANAATEPPVVTEINVIESNSDNDHQESSLYEEIMLQDESKPLEDSYNSNSHSYFGQRIRPKRT